MAFKNRKPRTSQQISLVSTFLIILIVVSISQELIFLSKDASENPSFHDSSYLLPTTADEDIGEEPTGFENNRLNGLGEIEIANFEVLGIPT
ncbi:MAG: hypothetical protein KAR20_22945, partial [Candidatus Heimdallarchaeota archaeon]|nr:hypothetical protein [Candidatus Heimdallarchaeota archaeon]